MKKALATILAFVYLTATTGATINLHYCMDKLVAWGAGEEKEGQKSCPHCNMTKSGKEKHCGKQNKGCCKDEHKQLKIEKDQKAANSGFDVSKPFIQLSSPVPSPAFFAGYIFSASVEYPLTHAPPRSGNVSMIVRNCVYRI